MKRTAFALLATLALAAPLSAQTMATLLPSISYPDGTVTPSTKGCETSTTEACQPQE